MEKFYLDEDLQYERSAFLNEEKLLSIDKVNQTAIDFYPNPAKHELTINLTSKSEVSIFDLQGKIVYQEVLSAGNQTLNVENKPSGKYILVINDFNTVKRQIFLKQ
jgi:hypothetical protein